MSQKISIFEEGCEAFSTQVSQSLGRGKEHAVHFYQEWFRRGMVEGRHPAFANAGVLLQEMRDMVDLTCMEAVDCLREGDTQKFLLKTQDGWELESVVIPMTAGLTLCVSSQVGCRKACAFCETGRMGLLRNLTAGEIVQQVFFARHSLEAPVRNVVFMGMGEPFDNYDGVIKAIRVLTDPKGLGVAPRHITVSTSGVADCILKFAEDAPDKANLAVSINAPDDERRDRLMPINKKFNLRKLYQTIEAYCDGGKREVMIGYVLMKGVNDSLEDAQLLADYLEGLSVRVNLIPYNPQSRDHFEAPEPWQVDAFWAALKDRGYQVLLRKTKGLRIMAACGQLGKRQFQPPIPKTIQLGSK